MRQLLAVAAALVVLGQAPAPTPTEMPAQQEPIYHGEASSILGRTVHGPHDEVTGRVVDVLVDDGGVPRAAVVDIGGFMGMGSRRIAIAWRALRFLTTNGRAGRIELELTLEQLKDTPEFKPPAGPADPPATVAAPPPK